jgi:hypothetical protein
MSVVISKGKKESCFKISKHAVVPSWLKDYTKLDIDKSFASKPMNRFELNDLLQKYKAFRDNIGKLMKSGSCTQADMKKLQTVRKLYDKIWDSSEN